MKQEFSNQLLELSKVAAAAALDPTFLSSVESATNVVIKAYAQKKKVLLCGNGGSAAQAQHIAAELVNRYKLNRPPMNAISLTTDTSNLTSIANDFGYEYVFSKQVEAIGDAGDVLIVFTTSDVSDTHSANILKAIEVANTKGMIVIGMFSAKTIKAAELVHYPIKIPSTETSHIQELHIATLHIMCEIVEREIASRHTQSILTSSKEKNQKDDESYSHTSV